jgi:tetratricopeptide (TPR) repeat protein
VNRERDSIGQQADDSRSERRGKAWELGIQGHYDAALEILDDLLKEKPLDVVSLRLKGNLLELKEMDLLEFSGRRLASSPDYLAARACYEGILEIDPRNVRARIDLGDHYRNLDANDKAIEWYSEAARALQQTPKGETWKDDVEELLNAVVLLTKHERLGEQAKLLESWCREALGATD